MSLKHGYVLGNNIKIVPVCLLIHAYPLSFAACNIPRAESYSSGCALSVCTTGWKVSDDKSKCEANVCLCPNGDPPSGATCAVDGANMCESCATGFELSEDKTACDGRVALDCGAYDDG